MNRASGELVRMLLKATQRAREPGSRGKTLLILTRSDKEAVQLMQKADLILLRSPHVSRNCYDGDEPRDRFCYCVSMPIEEETEYAPGSVWLANIAHATPSEMVYFYETWDGIYWPDLLGVYAAVTWEQWKTTWEPWEDSTSDIPPHFNPPHYRPQGITSDTLFHVGIPGDWVQPPKVSIWEHLRRNVENSSICRTSTGGDHDGRQEEVSQEGSQEVQEVRQEVGEESLSGSR